MLRWLTAGESHGRALMAICEGVPAGVEVATADIAAALARRRAGYGRGARMKFEQDEVELTAGVRHGRTLGGPVAIRIANTEWPKWETVMSPDAVDEDALASQARNAPLTRPRPGHADLAGMQKYGFDDARAGAGAGQRPGDRGQGRAGRGGPPVPAPGAGRRDRQPRGGHRPGARPGRRGAAAAGRWPPWTPTRCAAWTRRPAPRCRPRSTRPAGTATRWAGSSRCVAYGLPPGLGSHVHWDRRLDGRLAGALMSIQAIKGVEIGDGLTTATRRGSQAHDEIEGGGDGRPPADQPGGRHRGRHEHRRAGPGAGGHEADLHRARGPWPPWTCAPASPPGPSTSAAT